MKLPILALTLSAAAGAVAQQGGFLQTCESIKVKGRYLTATCNSITGGNKRCSKLDLNKCLKNQFGQLVPDSLGMGPGFAEENQCVECSNTQPSSGGLVIGGPSPASLMNCKCNSAYPALTSSKTWPTAYFDLNTLVSNIDGRLKCFENTAGRC